MNAYNSPIMKTQGDELVAEHVELVKRIAHHLLARLPSTVDLDDLMQAGLMGLIEASGNYDASKGASFETYAGIRIRGCMLDEVRKLDWTPRSVHQKHRQAGLAIQALEGRLDRPPSESEIAEEMGVGLDEYRRILTDTASCKLFSIEQPSEQFETRIDIADSDSPGPDQLASIDDTHAALEAALDEIPERERLVLSLYYQQELNLKEIGAVLGVSESRISQIHGQALQRLNARLTPQAADI